MKTIFLCILFSFLISEDKKWKTLQEGTVLIKVLEDEYPQCSAEIIISSSVENILSVIEDGEKITYLLHHFYLYT